jgi:ribosomal protein L11 methyltransferase
VLSSRSRSWPAIDVNPVPDLFEAALTDYDASAVEERAAGGWRIFFGSAAERDRAASALRAGFPGLTITIVDVPDENWAARSQAALRSVTVGGVVVAPPWDVPAGGSAGDLLTIVIQPSMGFGTGHHATTRLCLAALQRLDLRGRSVLDVGTGSGVLAIAASLLGAGRVLGIDDDADAIASARESLELNPRARVTLAVGDLRSADLARADVVVANLTGALLVMTAELLRQLVMPGGRLVLSGLMADEEAAVRGAFPSCTVEHRAQEDEWLCLTLSRG